MPSVCCSEPARDRGCAGGTWGGGVLPLPGLVLHWTKGKASAQTSMEAVFQHEAPGLTQDGNNPCWTQRLGAGVSLCVVEYTSPSRGWFAGPIW